MRKLSLSPTTLNLFKDCPRCFWFHIIKGRAYKRPEGPVSTLPRGMDALIKDYFDIYRHRGQLPPEVQNIAGATLVDQGLITRWRNWRTGLECIDHDGHRLFGALDECVVCNNQYIPVDYKTRGFPLKEDSTSYYILQMSCYNFLLAKNGYAVSDYAYLLFYIPRNVDDNGAVQFEVNVQKVGVLTQEEVYKVFRDALSVLSAQLPPVQAATCKFCSWLAKVGPTQETQMKLF